MRKAVVRVRLTCISVAAFAAMGAASAASAAALHAAQHHVAAAGQAPNQREE